MMRKKKFDYFKAMEQLADGSLQASAVLTEIITDYHSENFIEQSEQIHQIESDCDNNVKEIMNELYVAFITPIDREDIVQLVGKLDNIIDGINDLTYEFHYLDIQELRDGTDEFMKLINAAIKAVQQAVNDFSHFKNSKTLTKNIDDANRIESLGDDLYTDHLAVLFREKEADPITIIRWQKIYAGFEKVLDSCEDCADVITGLAIKNS